MRFSMLYTKNDNTRFVNLDSTDLESAKLESANKSKSVSMDRAHWTVSFADTLSDRCGVACTLALDYNGAILTRWQNPEFAGVAQ